MPLNKETNQPKLGKILQLSCILFYSWKYCSISHHFYASSTVFYRFKVVLGVNLSIDLYIRCLKIHETHATANNTTNNNLVFFLVSDLKIIYSQWLLILNHNALDKIGKNILCHNLFGDKIIQNYASKILQDV